MQMVLYDPTILQNVCVPLQHVFVCRFVEVWVLKEGFHDEMGCKWGHKCVTPCQSNHVTPNLCHNDDNT
jgi:hypothetical protein